MRFFQPKRSGTEPWPPERRMTYGEISDYPDDDEIAELIAIDIIRYRVHRSLRAIRNRPPSPALFGFGLIAQVE